VLSQPDLVVADADRDVDAGLSVPESARERPRVDARRWGYSNAPPAVAGVIALMRRANPALPITEIKNMLIGTGGMCEDFLVLNAEKAVAAALAWR
jgi:hypothetical protein